ncbi:MAG: flagellar basal body L-ring protein FlgH, partial [Gammaproteobacteria bacterium]|nr:flagellar basal body L-ring protein FlgH [Gammaproteobacteria bacterium]
MKLLSSLSLISLVLTVQGCSSTRIAVKPDPQYAPGAIQEIEYEAPNNGSIYQEGRAVRLFEDNKAFRIGDI